MNKTKTATQIKTGGVFKTATEANKEINRYYEMLRLMFELNQPKSDGVSMDIKVFLSGFHKYWIKYHTNQP